eukprot:CAMPEP_0170555196 /NCGR_PEP_ID=MMETSP0211-20121228/13092_1 /TAXON_ID=311385 /ORGANISM="Pseudokeronopsis sp., Strain OXSARD2" /LENGTH=59 /DNA_ID=CAMNT_0010864861 /DNA_START=64 /DNA_END=239 /DNA_ORIENTATION=+
MMQIQLVVKDLKLKQLLYTLDPYQINLEIAEDILQKLNQISKGELSELQTKKKAMFILA